jgi:ABC-type sulfate transport system substrate-binding protein
MNLQRLRVIGKSSILALAVLIGAARALAVPSLASAGESALLNVSYDPTRELYDDYNAVFAKYWKAKTSDDLDQPARSADTRLARERGKTGFLANFAQWFTDLSTYE